MPVRVKKMRQYRDLELLFDSAEIESALERFPMACASKSHRRKRPYAIFLQCDNSGGVIAGQCGGKSILGTGSTERGRRPIAGTICARLIVQFEQLL
jgi:hypothetical protein